MAKSSLDTNYFTVDKEPFSNSRLAIQLDENDEKDTESTPLLHSGSFREYYDIRSEDSNSLSESSGSEVSLTSIERRNQKVALVLFALFSFAQSSAFVDWNPIENSILTAFKSWTETTISWQANMSILPSIILQWPLSFILQKLKLSTVIKFMGVFPLCLATIVRVLPLLTLENPGEVFKVLVFISSFSIGVIGVIFYSSLSKFSYVYFGSAAMTLPTGVAILSSNIGVVFSFVLGPFVVDDPLEILDEEKILQGEIRNYLLLYAVIIGALSIVIIFTFPDPIYVGQVNQSPSIMNNIYKIMKDKDVTSLLFTYALSSIPIYWSSTFLPIYFQRYSFGQEIVGGLMSASVVISGLITVVTTRMVDSRKVSPWMMILVLSFAQFISSLIMSLFLSNYFPPIEVCIGMFFVISNAIGLSMGPLVIPYGSKLGRNISVEILNGAFHQFSCFSGSLFLLLFAIYDQREWVPYSLTLCPCLAFLIFLLVKNN